MNNQAIGLSLIVFALIGLLVAVSAYVRRKRITGTRWFICLCVFNTLWAVLDALVYLVPNESAVSVFQGTKLAFAGTSILIIYILVQKNLKMEMLLSSREVIFEQSENIMFILNNEREIIDMNSQAKRIVDQSGIKETKGLTYDDIYDQWTARNNVRDFAEDASIFTIEEDDRNIHYQKLSSSIYNKKGVLTGTFIEIKNITPIMTLIHKLQDSAYFDYLTGLHNRNYLISIINDWSEKELLEKDILPLGIVVGDVNGLKRINDVYGHSKGDLLLQLVAAELSKYKPEGGITFRMGGDEFITLVPRSNKEELNYYVNVMENKDYSLVNPELAEAGIAISYVLKKDNNISIMESIHEADVLMYTKKKNRRKAGKPHEEKHKT